MNNHVNLLNLSFGLYAELFGAQDECRSDRWIEKRGLGAFLTRIGAVVNLLRKICCSDKWLSKLDPWVKVLSVKDDQRVTAEDLNQIILENPSCRILVLRSWDISCPEDLLTHQEEVRRILSPVEPFRRKAELLVDELRLTHSTLIGVHARRGDYKHFLEGKLYYSWEQYASWIKQARKALESKGVSKVGFLLCSDEKPPKASFKDLPVHYSSAERPIEDLHSLSLCDYLMGPPSSFGTWASWHGDAPRLILESNACITDRKQFEPTLYC